MICTDASFPGQTHADAHAPDPGALHLATWNIHRTRGAGGRPDAGRILRLMADDAAFRGLDALVLTEADADCPPHAGLLDPAAVTAATGLVHAQGDAALRWHADSLGFLGIAVFLHPGLAVTAAAVVDLPGHCHRGAAVFDLVARGRAFRLAAAHLSLTQALRAVQMRTLAQFLRRRPPLPLVLAGDLNEWRPWGGLAFGRALTGRRLSGPAPRTFPARLPLLPLDRVLGADGARVTAARAQSSAGLRRASDHLPLRAVLRIG